MTKRKTKKKKSYGTSGGVELTDEVLQRMADEAEAGIDPSRLKPRRGRPSMGSGAAAVFQVRLEPELFMVLHDRAQAEQTSPSELVRRILRREFGFNKRNKQA